MPADDPNAEEWIERYASPMLPSLAGIGKIDVPEGAPVHPDRPWLYLGCSAHLDIETREYDIVKKWQLLPADPANDFLYR